MWTLFQKFLADRGPARPAVPVTVIRPDRSWLHVPWREVFHYRDLLFLMVRRNFVASYKQTVLGPTWFVVQPLMQTLIFTVVFGHLAGLSTEGLPKPLFYLCGTLGWGYFARCLGATSSVFTANAGIFGKVYFPRLVVPLASVLTNLVGFSIQIATFLCFWCYFNFFTTAGPSISMSPMVVFVPLLLLQSAAIGMGVGLWLSALSAKYRDISFVSGYLTSLWMYATPVVYPLSQLSPKWQRVISLNPMTFVVESFRVVFLGTGTIEPYHLPLSLLTTVLLLLSGVMVFNRKERTFIDTI